ATVTRCLREVLSRSAPRKSSSTTETLRLADQRPAPGKGAADSGDCSVALRAPSAAPESGFFRLDTVALLRTFLTSHVPREPSNEIPGRRSNCPTRLNLCLMEPG